MTSVIFREVQTNLQRLMKRPGGIKASQALAAAEANLGSIQDACLASLDAELAEIRVFAGLGATRRLEHDELRSLIGVAERALTVTTGVSIPLIGEALRMVCSLAEALMETEHWPEGALEPALNTLTLIRHGQLDRDSGEMLLGELQRCLERYQRLASKPQA